MGSNRPADLICKSGTSPSRQAFSADCEIATGSESLNRLSKGFSLIEVLVAMAILGFVAIGIAGLFTRAMVVNASAHDYANLANMTREVLEEFESQSFDDLNGSESWTIPEGLSEDDESTMYYFEYTVLTYDINSWADIEGDGSWPAAGASGNVKKITLVVKSKKPFGGRRELTTTVIKVQGQ